MVIPTNTKSHERKHSSGGGLMIMLLSLILVCFMPTSQSLWIDESTTALLSLKPNVRSLATALAEDLESNSQMPLGNFYFWLGARVTGHSELALRALSSLWIAFGVVILWQVGLVTRMPYLPALFACHSFVWYYASEVRPYAMQIGLGCVLLYALVFVRISTAHSNRGMMALVVAAPLLSATSLLAVIPVAMTTLLIGLTLLRRGLRLRGRDIGAIAVSGGLTALVGFYYVLTLLAGKGAGSRDVWGVGIENGLYAGYELLGFSGFGPPRYALRTIAADGGVVEVLAHFGQWWSFPLSGMLLALYVVVAIRAVSAWRADRDSESRLIIGAGTVVLASVASLYGLALAVGFPFWGRHLAPTLPFLLFAVAAALTSQAGSGRLRFVIPAVLCLTLLASSLLVRFREDHARDDYRAAASIAKAAIRQGLTVWWSASLAPPVYYCLELCQPAQTQTRSCVANVVNADGDLLRSLRRPDVIIASKPDLYDQNGALERYVETHRYRLSHEVNAFRILEPPRITSEVCTQAAPQPLLGE